jgi:hypothetical protein
VADEKPKRKSRSSDSDDSGGRRRRSSGGPLSGGQLAQRARKELSAITGLEAESVTSLERHDDGTWKVTVEMLELSRVPETDDVLGAYETELDENGELLGYRRIRRYARSQAGDSQATPGG